MGEETVHDHFPFLIFPRFSRIFLSQFPPQLYRYESPRHRHCRRHRFRQNNSYQRHSRRLDKSRVKVIQHDSYYRDLSAHGGLTPEKVNFDHPDSLETPLLIEHVQAPSKEGGPIDQPIYNFTTHRRMDSTLADRPTGNHHHRRNPDLRRQRVARTDGYQDLRGYRCG